MEDLLMAVMGLGKMLFAAWKIASAIVTGSDNSTDDDRTGEG